MVVSFPRDLWVEIPGEGPAKLNAAYSRGGAKLAVETFETNFDITINHYLEVNFATFREIVDAIGEVHLFFPTSARDTVTGLSVDNPGCQALDADQALAYVRSREYEYYESDGQGGGEWKQDPTADIGRIRRQQYFIRSLMNEAIADGARDLGKARQLLRRTVSKLRTDPNVGFRDLYRLYKAFRSTDAEGVEMLTVPADLDRSEDGQSILVIRRDDADPIFDRLRQLDKGETTKTTKPSTVEPATISVGVLNGSGVQGAAATALDALVDLGFQRGDAANAVRDDYETTEVRYGRGRREAAQLIADQLVAGGELREDVDIEYDVVVIVGRDYAGVAEPDEPIVATTGGPTTTTGPPANPGTTPGVTVPPSEVGRPLVGCG
jgi:polyisoprenyl-teichoic acid--peptidoglycan teichoic acid transferase